MNKISQQALVDVLDHFNIKQANWLTEAISAARATPGFLANTARATPGFLANTARATPGFMKNLAIGDPRKFLSQVRNNELFSKEGPYNLKNYLGPNIITKGLNIGLPALSIHSALKSPEEGRGEAVGSTTGSLVGGFLGAPLGMVGQTIGSGVLGSLGGRIGKMFDPERKPMVQSQYGYSNQQ